MSEVSEMSEQPPGAATRPTLERLEARFERHHQDSKVARGKPYLSGAQIVHRLNEVLGLDGWTHSVLREGVWADSDEIWVYGRLVGWIDGLRFEREDYGSKRVTRNNSTKEPTQMGDDYQAAKTDSLKRCSKQLGVGAYLNDDVGAIALGPVVDPETGELLVCATCNQPLDVVKFANNSTWSIADLAARSRSLTNGKVLCKIHYFQVREERQAQAAGATGARRGAA
jgi:hypothetical protein